MKARLTTALALAWAWAAQAQPAMDTVGNARALPLGVDSLSAFRLQGVRDNPVWLPSVDDGYNRITVSAAFDKGAFIPAQGSTQTQHYRTAAEGKTSWKGTRLYGRFAYDRVLEDSTRLRHQTRINPSAPVYFGSLRYNHYERSVYTFAVAGQRDALPGNLPVTLALDYRIGEHFSNNDPRGAISDFQLNLLGGVGYRQGPWEYHLSARYGYGRERVQVGFKNVKYTQNTEDPLYINWYMNGYGNASQRISNPQRQYDDGFRRMGAGGHVRRQTGNGYWSADVGWLQEQQRFKRLDGTIQTYTLLNTYTLNQWRGVLTAVRQLGENRTIQADARVTLHAGSDFEPIYQAKNYTYSRVFADAGARIGSERWQYGARGGVEATDQRDGVAGVISTAGGLLASGYAERRLLLGGSRILRTGVAVQYRHALGNDLVFPALAETPFSKHVVYHDFLYRTASALTYGLSCGYAFPTGKGSRWDVSVSANYQRCGGLSGHALAAPSLPGADRFAGSVQLSWFF